MYTRMRRQARAKSDPMKFCLTETLEIKEVERPFPGASHDPHRSEDCGESHVDTRQPLQESPTPNGGSTRADGEGKRSAPPITKRRRPFSPLFCRFNCEGGVQIELSSHSKLQQLISFRAADSKVRYPSLLVCNACVMEERHRPWHLFRLPGLCANVKLTDKSRPTGECSKIQDKETGFLTEEC